MLFVMLLILCKLSKQIQTFYVFHRYFNAIQRNKMNFSSNLKDICFKEINEYLKHINMALKITQKNKKFFIKGKITTDNVQSMRIHLEYVLENCKGIVIDVSKLTEININSVNVLAKMYKKALLTGKKFSIVGAGSKYFYDHFRTQI